MDTLTYQNQVSKLIDQWINQAETGFMKQWFIHVIYVIYTAHSGTDTTNKNFKQTTKWYETFELHVLFSNFVTTFDSWWIKTRCFDENVK